MFTAVSRRRPLASAAPSTLDPPGIPLGYSAVGLCRGDPAALHLQDWPVLVLQQLQDRVAVWVGQLRALAVGLGGRWAGQLPAPLHPPTRARTSAVPLPSELPQGTPCKGRASSPAFMTLLVELSLLCCPGKVEGPLCAEAGGGGQRVVLIFCFTSYLSFTEISNLIFSYTKFYIFYKILQIIDLQLPWAARKKVESKTVRGGLLLKVKAVFFLFREGVIKILSNKTNHEDQFLSVH